MARLIFKCSYDHQECHKAQPKLDEKGNTHFAGKNNKRRMETLCILWKKHDTWQLLWNMCNCKRLEKYR